MTVLFSTLFALLTVVAFLITVGAVALARRPGAAIPGGHIVAVMATVTGTATLGSIYLSEVAGYVPCELCWVQRIFAYSLATITTTAVLRRRHDVIGYTVPLAAMGLATSIWHVIVQRLPAAGATCDPTNPCSAIWIERFGFITIPVMAGAAFLVVLALAWLHHRRGVGAVSHDGASEVVSPPSPSEMSTT